VIRDLACALLCSLRLHDWHTVSVEGPQPVVVVTEVCARRGCRGRTSRRRLVVP
jgi:hypothetical protein